MAETATILDLKILSRRIERHFEGHFFFLSDHHKINGVSGCELSQSGIKIIDVKS